MSVLLLVQIRTSTEVVVTFIKQVLTIKTKEHEAAVKRNQW